MWISKTNQRGNQPYGTVACIDHLWFPFKYIGTLEFRKILVASKSMHFGKFTKTLDTYIVSFGRFIKCLHKTKSISGMDTVWVKLCPIWDKCTASLMTIAMEKSLVAYKEVKKSKKWKQFLSSLFGKNLHVCPKIAVFLMPHFYACSYKNTKEQKN